MIIATLRVKVPADQRKILLDSVRSVTGRTSVKPGCISCKFYQDIDESLRAPSPRPAAMA